MGIGSPEAILRRCVLKRFGAGVCFTLLLLSMAAVSCKQETDGGARKESDSRRAPSLISEERQDFLNETEAAVKELRKKADVVEDDLRRSARRASANRELVEVRDKIKSIEASLDELRKSGSEATDELKADIAKREDEIEMLINRASSGMG